MCFVVMAKTDKEKKEEEKKKRQERLRKLALGLAAAGTLAGLGAGAYFGHKYAKNNVAKKMTKQRAASVPDLQMSSLAEITGKKRGMSAPSVLPSGAALIKPPKPVKVPLSVQTAGMTPRTGMGRPIDLMPEYRYLPVIASKPTPPEVTAPVKRRMKILKPIAEKRGEGSAFNRQPRKQVKLSPESLVSGKQVKLSKASPTERPTIPPRPYWTFERPPPTPGKRKESKK